MVAKRTNRLDDTTSTWPLDARQRVTFSPYFRPFQKCWVMWLRPFSNSGLPIGTFNLTETPIMFRDDLRLGIHHVGLALRDPEAFAAAWNEGRNDYQWPVWLSLLATAIVGTTTYGMTMGLLGGAGDIFYKSFACT